MSLYVKKLQCPVLCTEMNDPVFGGMYPYLISLFSVSSISSPEKTEEAEEAPTFGRGSSLS
jgi:hypothetical protein